MLNPHVFRAYDVRGLVGQDINPGVFRQVGRAYATLIRRDSGRRVAVGQDNRVSSAVLKAAFVEASAPPAWTWWTSASSPRRSSTSRPRTGGSTAGPTSRGVTTRSSTTA